MAKCIDVTADNFGAIFAAFQMIDYDNGRVNRLETAATVYHVPIRFANDLDGINKALAWITPDQLAVFCCGEKSEKEALISSDSLLKAALLADLLLDRYFNGRFDDAGPDDE